MLSDSRPPSDSTEDMNLSGDGDQLTLSFVIPAYNEKINIRPLAERIINTCDEAGIDDFEAIFVENGSRDGSDIILRELHEKDNRIKMLQLSRNFGYQGAVTAGLKYSRGNWVAMLDGDQQDPPELIPEMLTKAKEGFEVVYGVRKRRQEGFFLKLAYKFFYKLWRSMSNIDIPADAGDYCLLNRKVVNVINEMPERQRFVRGLRAWSGFRQIGFDYERDARKGGESKFNLTSSISLAMDGLFAYSVVPIRATILLGIIVTAISIFIALGNALFWLISNINPEMEAVVMVKGLTQVNLIFSILFGVLLLCLGVIGEYIGRIYEEVKQRPQFIVREKLF